MLSLRNSRVTWCNGVWPISFSRARTPERRAGSAGKKVVVVAITVDRRIKMKKPHCWWSFLLLLLINSFKISLQEVILHLNNHGSATTATTTNIMVNDPVHERYNNG